MIVCLDILISFFVPKLSKWECRQDGIIIMVELISFVLGALALPLAWKTSRIIYRIAPYLYPTGKPSKAKEQLVVIAGATDGIGLEYLRRLSP